MLFNPKVGLEPTPRLIVNDRLAKRTNSFCVRGFGIVLAVYLAYALHSNQIRRAYINNSSPIAVQNGPELFDVFVGDVEMNHDEFGCQRGQTCQCRVRQI